MRTLMLTILLAVVGGLAIWSFLLLRQQGREMSELLTEEQRKGPCGVERVGESLKAFEGLTQRWDDEETIARTTPRIALAGPVSDLRRTQRELADLEVAPCLAAARRYRVEAMKATLDMFRAFMAEQDFGVFSAQLKAEEAEAESERRTLAIREHLYPEAVSQERAVAAEAERQRLAREAEEAEARRVELARVAEERRKEEEARLESQREAHARLQRIREETAAQNAENARQIKQAREAKMKGWGSEYSREMGPAKAALREVISASEKQNAQALSQACGRLQAAVTQLGESSIRRVPDGAVHLQFEAVLRHLDRVGQRCAGGDSGSVRYAVADLQRALQGFAAALKPYGLTP